MLKAVYNDISKSTCEADPSERSFTRTLGQCPRWLEILLWPKTTRYLHYDQFLYLVVTVWQGPIPVRVASSWYALQKQMCIFTY